MRLLNFDKFFADSYGFLLRHIDILPKIADLATIVGLGLAILGYVSWVERKSKLSASEYAIELIDKLVSVKYSIFDIGSPRFESSGDELLKRVEDIFIPAIKDCCSQLYRLKVRLHISKYFFDDSEIKELFQELIIEGVMKDLNWAIYNFYLSRRSMFFKLEESEIYKLICSWDYHSETGDMTADTGHIICASEFNKKVERDFNKIQCLLERHIVGFKREK
jgi:hypothetical protein